VPASAQPPHSVAGLRARGKQYNFKKVKSTISTWMGKQNGLLFPTSTLYMIKLFECEMASQLRSMQR
jgi:hypothetical protein